MIEEWEEADNALKAFTRWVATQIARDFEAIGCTDEYKAKIYHYTDAKGALGIVRSGHLWFTERAHLNDPAEIAYGVKIAHEIFEREARLRKEKIPPRAAEHLWGEHASSLTEYGFWVVSFSFNGDHLCQWQNYADDGRGVCLEFSTDKFDMIEVVKPLPCQPNSLRYPVSYDDRPLRRRLKPYIDGGLNVLEMAALPSRPSYRPNGRALLYERDLFGAMNNGLIANAAMHKHPAYIDEQEYRLLISGLRATFSKSSFHRTRMSNDETIGYFDLPIPHWGQIGSLTHIRLGPAAPADLGDQIDAALRANGNPVPPIERSCIPYRSKR